MKNLIKKELEHKRFAASTTALAGATGATATAVTAIAGLVASTGFSALAVTIGISSAPLIVTAAPIIVGIATTAGAVAAISRTYSWVQGRREEASQGE